MQQQTRKPSLLKTLFGAKRRQHVEPKRTLQPLDERQQLQVAGGTTDTGSPKSGWQ
jgi:hypothetical protein